MAESKNNVLTHGLSGKVGDLIVFRVRGNKTFVSSKPKERTDGHKVTHLTFSMSCGCTLALSAASTPPSL